MNPLSSNSPTEKSIAPLIEVQPGSGRSASWTALAKACAPASSSITVQRTT